MDDTDRQRTRRRFLEGAVTVSLTSAAGCLDSTDDSSSPDGDGAGDADPLPEYDGPLTVTDTTLIDDSGQTVTVLVTSVNDGVDARNAELVVELTHTEAEGAISRERTLLLDGGAERSSSVTFRPKFFGSQGSRRPTEGEFQFDTTFQNVDVLEDYPGPVERSERTPIDGGSDWPATRYDAGTAAHNPGTTVPTSEPTSVWTAPEVEHAYGSTGPVVRDGSVYAGRPVQALGVEDGDVRWTHDGPDRVGDLTVGDGVVAFGTTDDFRALDAESGEVQWTVSAPGNTWQGDASIVDGRILTWAPGAQGAGKRTGSTPGTLYAIEAASGDVAWSVETEESLLGAPPVSDGLVLTDGNPLRAIDVDDGTEVWSWSGGDSVVTAAVAYDTIYVLAEEQLTALDVAEGRERWLSPGAFHPVQIAVGNGAVYLQTEREYEPVAFDAVTGDVRWVCEATEYPLGAPCVTSDALVVQSERGPVYAIDTATGDLRWSLDVAASRPGTVGLADDICYLNETRGPLHALAAEQ